MRTIQGASRQQTITAMSLGSGHCGGRATEVMAALPLALGPKRIRRVPPGTTHKRRGGGGGQGGLEGTPLLLRCTAVLIHHLGEGGGAEAPRSSGLQHTAIAPVTHSVAHGPCGGRPLPPLLWTRVGPTRDPPHLRPPTARRVRRVSHAARCSQGVCVRVGVPTEAWVLHGAAGAAGRSGPGVPAMQHDGVSVLCRERNSPRASHPMPVVPHGTRGWLWASI